MCSTVLQIRNRIQVLNCKKEVEKTIILLYLFLTFLHIPVLYSNFKVVKKVKKTEDDFTLFAKCDILSLRNFSEKLKQWIQIQIRRGM
jgi:hypothetical protein